MRPFFSICFFVLAFALVAEAQSDVPKPVGSQPFFVDPGAETTLIFHDRVGRTLPFHHLAPDGSVLSEGNTINENDRQIVRVAAPKGFSEIEFPDFKDGESTLRFGVVALPAFSAEKRDPFFCIDAAFSWLVADDRRREDYVRIAARIGISTLRERVSWNAINREEGKFDWNADRRYDKLRQSIKAAGLDVLELFHDAPAWAGRGGLGGDVGKFPGDLIKTADAWEVIARHWEPTWGALEIWNEPNISFGGNVPADQYVPMVRAITYRLKKSGVRVPLIGGSLAHLNRAWLETAKECGLLECIDGFSFHTYSRAPAVETMIRDFSALVQSDRPDMTLWLTECGRPWKRGPARPPREQDVVSACDIVMKGVESKASVVDHYFPFVYPYYDERENNFGMMDKNGSPMRCIAAYAQMIRMLSGCEPVDGDPSAALKTLDGPPLKMTRLFRKAADSEDETILVLYTGETTQATTFRPTSSKSVEFLDAESLSGEPVSIAEDGTLTIRDGLVYVRVKTIAVQKYEAGSGVSESVRHRKEKEVTRRGTEPRTVVGPIAVAYRFDPEAVEPSSTGYHLKRTPTERLPLRLRIFNVDEKPHRVAFKPIVPTGDLKLAENETTVLEIPARNFAEQTVSVDFGDALTQNGKTEIRFQYEIKDVSPKDPSPCRIQLVFFGEPTWEKLMQATPNAVRLPIEEPKRWRKNIAGIGKLEMDTLEKKPEVRWAFRASFGKGDRWVYPVFTVPEDVDLSNFKGLILRARCTAGSTQPRLMIFETATGSGYLTSDRAFRADGEWRIVKIPFESLEFCGATRPDPNGRLDLDKVRTFSIGANTKEESILVEVSDCLLYD